MFYINYEEFKVGDQILQGKMKAPSFILTMRNLKVNALSSVPFIVEFYINYEEFKDYLSYVIYSETSTFYINYEEFKVLKPVYHTPPHYKFYINYEEFKESNQCLIVALVL